MDPRAARSLSGAPSASVQMAEPGWPSFDLTFGLPERIAGLVVMLFRPGSTLPGRDGIAVGPMSAEWLQKCATDSGKRGDLV